MNVSRFNQIACALPTVIATTLVLNGGMGLAIYGVVKYVQSENQAFDIFVRCLCYSYESQGIPSAGPCTNMSWTERQPICITQRGIGKASRYAQAGLIPVLVICFCFDVFLIVVIVRKIYIRCHSTAIERRPIVEAAIKLEKRRDAEDSTDPLRLV